MERVGALIHKLKDQYDQNVDKNSLLVTVQLLLAELTQQAPAAKAEGKVSVTLPRVHHIVQDVPSVTTDEPQLAEAPPATEGPAVPQAPAVTGNAANSREIPDTIKSYILKPPPQPVLPKQPVKQEERKPPVTETPPPPPAKPARKEEQTGLLFDPAAEAETPVKFKEQREVYELNDVHIDGDSLNDRLKEEKIEVGSSIKSDPVNDLKRAIGINDRYRFINELFRGDEAMYERSIKTINAFASVAEAETWIQRELKVKIGWADSNPTVKDFDQVVKRRFS